MHAPLTGLICETMDGTDIKPIRVYKLFSALCKCTEQYKGSDDNLVNINNVFFLSYSAATFLKLAFLEGSSFKALSDVMWDTLEMSTSYSIGVSKDH